MKINITGTIKDLKGQNIKDGETTVDLTVKDVFVRTLISIDPTREKPDGVEDYKSYKLAQKIENSKKEISLEAEDVVKLKKLIPLFWPPIIIGRMFDLIDPQD